MTDASSMTLLNFRLPRDLKKRFHDSCRKNRSRMSTELVRLVNHYLHLELAAQGGLERMKRRAGTSFSGITRIDADTGLPITD